jgi:nicotinamide mononucleotide (NMN) deamidase PncC
MSFPPPSFDPILKKIAQHLTSNKQKVSVAETAAGGLISASLLSVPGASAYFGGGATLYTLPSRKAYAGWTNDDLKKYKCVEKAYRLMNSGPTEKVVLGLAKNVNEKLETAWTVGESGTAGPTGGHEPNRTP